MKKAECRMQKTSAALKTKRNLARKRTTETVMATARGLFRMLAAMRAPCSVKALGDTGENFNRRRWSQFVTTSAFSSEVSKKAKSPGKRAELRLTAWLRAFVLTPYKAARSASRMTFSPLRVRQWGEAAGLAAVLRWQAQWAREAIRSEK
jgi:hypothetical protein